MAQLYADEDFSYPAIQRLRQFGQTSSPRTRQVKRARVSQTDAVIAFATVISRAVVTFNRRHFIRLHAEVTSHARHHRLHP